MLASVMHWSAHKPTILYSNALLEESEVGESMKTKRDLSLFILVTEQTTVCSVLSSFSQKPGVRVGRFLFHFYFYFSLFSVSVSHIIIWLFADFDFDSILSNYCSISE